MDYLELIKNNDVQAFSEFSNKIFKFKDANKNNFLLLACALGKKEIALICLKHLAVDSKNASGETSLMLASMYGHKDIVDLLLENKANVDARSKSRNYAFSLAVRNNHQDIARTLMQNNCDIHKWDIDFLSPLEYCLQNKNEAMLDIILEERAEPAEIKQLIKEASSYMIFQERLKKILAKPRIAIQGENS